MNDPHPPPPPSDQPPPQGRSGRHGRPPRSTDGRPTEGQWQPGHSYPPAPPPARQQPPDPGHRQPPQRGRHARPGQPPPPQPQQPAPGPHTHEHRRPAYPPQPRFQPPPPYPPQHAHPPYPHPYPHPQQYPPPHRPDERDGTGAPGRPGGGDADGTDGPAGPRRSRLGPRTRRVVEACVLAVLLPALLGIHWIDESDRAESLEPPVRVSSVANGRIGEMLGARWTVYRRDTVPGTNDGQDVVELRVVLAVKARDAKSVQAVGGFGTTYRFVDGQGHEWGADGRTSTEARPGKVFPLTVQGTVHRAKAGSLALVVRAPETARKGGAPLPSLRFEP